MLLTGEQLYLSGVVPFCYTFDGNISIMITISQRWAAASSSWRGNLVQLPYAVARLNITGYIDEHNYYFGTNSGKHKSNGGNGNSNSSNNINGNSSSNNASNHNTIGKGNGMLVKRLLYKNISSRRLNKVQNQQQRRSKKRQYDGSNYNTRRKEIVQYQLQTTDTKHRSNCDKFTSVFTNFECLWSFLPLSSRSPSPKSVIPAAEINEYCPRQGKSA